MYSVDGENFYKVTRITKIPAQAGDELYVDVIPIELTDEFVDMLRRGVKIFYLRRLTLFKPMYEKLGINTKSAKNDIKALMALEAKWFREVSEDFLAMRRLISAYRGLLKSHQRLANAMKALEGLGREIMETAIESVGQLMVSIANIIAEEAGNRILEYKKVVETLGIDGDNYLSVREALAEVMTCIDPRRNFRKTANFFGLFRGNPERYNARARQALQRLSMSLGNTKEAKQEKRILYTVWKTMRTHERLEAISA
ncbi:MAG: hypothetical protein QW240_02150 [Candidatus Caldarchaeum sp.]